MEKLTLTTPVTTTLTVWQPGVFNLDWTTNTITIDLVGSNGENLHKSYSGAVASSRLASVNAGIFTLVSFHKTAFTWLIADGVVAGTVTGTPG